MKPDQAKSMEQGALLALWRHGTVRQLAAFVGVGVVNTLFGYGIFALLIWLGLHYALASFLATVLGVLFNFLTTGRLVFKSSDNRLLGRFACVYGVVYLGNVAGLWGLDKLGVNAYWGGAALLVPATVLSYLLQRYFVFRREAA